MELKANFVTGECLSVPSPYFYKPQKEGSTSKTSQMQPSQLNEFFGVYPSQDMVQTKKSGSESPKKLKRQNKMVYIRFVCKRLSDKQLFEKISTLGELRKAYVCSKHKIGNFQYGFATFKLKKDFDAACHQKVHWIDGVKFNLRAVTPQGVSDEILDNKKGNKQSRNANPGNSKETMYLDIKDNKSARKTSENLPNQHTIVASDYKEKDKEQPVGERILPKNISLPVNQNKAWFSDVESNSQARKSHIQLELLQEIEMRHMSAVLQISLKRNPIAKKCIAYRVELRTASPNHSI